MRSFFKYPIFNSNLKVSRESKKGYAATFGNFFEVRCVESGSESGKPVDINKVDKPAVDLLWKETSSILNPATIKMIGILVRFGVKSSYMSPFCRKFDSVLDLL